MMMIMTIAGLRRGWGHRLKKDSFRGSMAFCLQGFFHQHHCHHIIRIWSFMQHIFATAIVTCMHALLHYEFKGRRPNEKTF